MVLVWLHPNGLITSEFFEHNQCKWTKRNSETDTTPYRYFRPSGLVRDSSQIYDTAREWNEATCIELVRVRIIAVGRFVEITGKCDMRKKLE